MAKREVTVVINGEETVGRATNEAGGALDGFAGKVPKWAAISAGLAAAFAVVSKAVGAMKDYVMDSFTAFDSFAASQTKMAAQSKLTGVSLDELQRIAQRAREEFGLGTVVANDAATTVGKYAARAGDATKANALLAAAMDLGAASGLNAAQTMEALEMGLRGQDEGFDKLLGKNPSSLWKEYADANGLAVGKMTDTEKRMAELTAVVEAGNTVQGSYNERLESGAGAQDRVNNRIAEAKVAFGQAMQPIRILVLNGLVPLIDFLGDAVLAVGRITNAVGVVLVGAFKIATSVVGDLAIGIGVLTRNKEMEEWGRRQSTAFADFREEVKKLEDKYLTAGKAAEDSSAKQTTATRTVATEVKTTAETVEQQAARMNRALDDKLGRPMQVVIGMTTGAIESLSRAATDQLAPAAAEKFNAHMRALADNAKLVAERVTTTATETEKGSRNGRSMADEIGMVARGALDAAESFGVIDDSASRSLNSAINIASALGRIASSGFSFAGVTGVIGGVASLVNSMMAGDAERRRLLRENNDALVRVSRDLNGLNLDLTGEDYANVGAALQQLFGSLGSARTIPEFMGAYGAFDQQMRDLGLTAGDLKRVADAYGIQITDKQGNFIQEGLRSLMNALSRTGPGQVGQGFGDQLQFFRDTQRVSGSSGLTQIQDLLTYLRDVGNVGALRDVDLSSPDAIRDALFAIRTQMNNGGLSGAALGRLSGGALNSLILEILGLLDDIEPAGEAGGDGAMTGGVTSSLTGDAPVMGGGFAISLKDVNDTIADMRDQTVPILTAHTTLHERIAAATEGSYTELRVVNQKLDELIAVTAGQLDAMNSSLEARRRRAALERGVLPVLT
jgi:hypothetical protein